ncbi:MAG: nucleotidyl transferase AbiEii/AbiGii toxin family protein [Anaerolineales bacterium]|nr:nucleotidyl transferase AbiEii/AbiGii toxin family protein [Anaerolineales bacterium]
MEIIDQPALSRYLALKGGTCAAMLGYLDRFSVDLDFDVLKNADEVELRRELHQVFDYLGFSIKGEFDKALIFQLRYPNEPGKRNTMKVSASSLKIKSNQYQVQYLAEIDRLMNCQTVETMFANKLVAVTDRYHLHRTVAGRDIYDIHHFIVHGYSYHAPIILERTGLEPKEYLKRLSDFIKKHVTQTIINEDLNALLPEKKFQQIRKVLIPETLSLIAREQALIK